MAKNMTFNASIRLNSSQFKKGVADVQRSLKSLQSSFLSLAGALGLGLSFQRLGASILDAATKFSDAKDVLGNVSKGMEEYGKNLEWLKKVANEYGVEMTGLIKSFSQFRAAASYSKLSIEQVRDVFESLTRAAGAFNLSADKTNGIMRTVSLMLSKGTIDSERYVRQLNTALPGAYNMMAQAAYNAGLITENNTEALEKAIKDGKIMADQVLPAFAKVLDDVTKNATFETLENSMNRLKNSWTDMAEGANFEGVYKKIIDAATKVVEFFTNGFWLKIGTAIAGVFGSTVVANGLKKFQLKVRETVAAVEGEYNELYKSIQAQDKKIAKLPGFGTALKESSNVVGRTVGGKNKYATMSPLILDEKEIRRLNLGEKEIVSLSKAVVKYNDDLLKLSAVQKQLTGKGVFSSGDYKEIQKYNSAVKGLVADLEGTGSAFEDLNGRAGVMGTVVSKGIAAFKALGAAIKSAFASIAIGAIISGITLLIGKIVEARKETKRVNNIVSDMKKNVGDLEGQETTAIAKISVMKKSLETFYDTLDDPSKIKVLDGVNKALGRTGDQMFTIASNINNEVIPALNEYINTLKKAAYQNAIFDQISSATSRIIKLEVENQNIRMNPEYGKTQRYQGGNIYSPIGGGVTQTELLTVGAQKLQGSLDKNNKEIGELQKGIDALIKLADDSTRQRLMGSDEVTDLPPRGDDDPGNPPKDTPQAALNKYKEELKKLDNQYKEGAILAADYKKKVEDLNQKAFEDLSAFGWDTAMKALATSADKALAEELKKTATAKLLEGLDDPEAIAEFDRTLQEEADKAAEQFKEAWDKFMEYRKKSPVFKDVDDSDSYMYSRTRKNGMSYSDYETHFNEAYLKSYEKYVEDLESYKQDLQRALKDMTDPESIKRLNELLDQTITKLEIAKLTVKDLKTKANISQLEKEIKDLQKEGIDAVFNSITSVADGMDRLYRAVQSLQQINDKTWKSEDLENFLTGLNAIIQAFEVVKSVIQAITAVTEVYGKIKEKETAKAIALNAAEAASEEAKASAAAGAAAAGAASSTAGIPIVGPVLAVAAVASVVAAIMAGMKKFAHGGFVGGHSYTGDKQIARLNSGELVLNASQQRNLLELANGKGNGLNGKVEFEIRGDRLKGVLQNYDRVSTH